MRCRAYTNWLQPRADITLSGVDAFAGGVPRARRLDCGSREVNREQGDNRRAENPAQAIARAVVVQIRCESAPYDPVPIPAHCPSIALDKPLGGTRLYRGVSSPAQLRDAAAMDAAIARHPDGTNNPIGYPPLRRRRAAQN
jgi:hypothetical protein